MVRMLGAWAIVCAVLAGPAAGQRVIMASYVGGSGNDALTGAAMTSDNMILLAGTMPGADLGFKPPARIQRGEGDGVILRLTAAGNRVITVLRFEGSVDDLETDEKGNVYATGAFGTVKLDKALVGETWRSEVGGEGARMAVGPDGGAVVLAKKTVTVLGEDGQAAKSWEVEADEVTDVACDVKNSLVFVTGRNAKGPEGSRAPIVFVYAYDLEGEKQWTAYDWTREEESGVGLTAGTGGTCLAMGEDGRLYLGGFASGGNSIWGRHSKDLAKTIPTGEGDKYQKPYNTGGAAIGFIGRLDPKTGDVLNGTMLLARDAGDKGAAMTPGCLAADARGIVYAGGKASAEPPVGLGSMGFHFKGEGAFFVAFDPRFNRVLAHKICGGTTRAIAVGRRGMVVVGSGRDHLKAVKPVLEGPTGTDGWAVVFSK